MGQTSKINSLRAATRPQLSKISLRSQLELYTAAQLGSEYLVSRKSQTELRAVNKEIAHLRQKLAALEARKTALERAIKI
jgi:ubiquinone biosynthesis protein UbiJ